MSGRGLTGCTDWQVRCNCERCQRDRQSLRALQAADPYGWVDQVVYQTRLYQEQIREMRDAAVPVLRAALKETRRG